jgi:dienelactone hydrolase
MRLGLVLCISNLLVLALPGPIQAQGDLVEDPSPLRVVIRGKPVRLEALTVRRADAAGRLPIALIAHGKPNTQGRMSDQHARDYLMQARDLARRGWLAVIVMRRGFGASDGPQPVPVSCASKSLIGRFDADADDIGATFAVIGQRVDADPARMIAIGVSAGGAAVVALSARNPMGLLGVVNVSGGLRSESCPKEDVLVDAFRAYGSHSKVPILWLYAKNDSFFGPDLVERMRAAFLEGGGDAKLVMFEPEGKDGHQMFATGPGRMKWLPEMDGFLRYLKLPTWTQSDVNGLMQKLDVKERSRAFVERYIAAPSEKALAREKGGSYLGESYGRRTVEEARKGAEDFCQRTRPACETLMENDRWVGPVAPANVIGAAAPANSSPQTLPSVLELIRAVPAGRKWRIEFLYSINPDCSSLGLASVRVLEEPTHGKLTVENGTGYPNFPQNNQRYECNRRQADGVAVFYEPNPEFIGSDSATIDVIFPSGLSRKQHYAIEVK